MNHIKKVPERNFDSNQLTLSHAFEMAEVLGNNQAAERSMRQGERA
jgi:hypothetical protein